MSAGRCLSSLALPSYHVCSYFDLRIWVRFCLGVIPGVRHRHSTVIRKRARYAARTDQRQAWRVFQCKTLSPFFEAPFVVVRPKVSLSALPPGLLCALRDRVNYQDSIFS